MELIPLIDQIATRYKEPVKYLTPSDYHKCDRHQWFKFRNVRHLSYDARGKAFDSAITETMNNWIKACGYRVSIKSGLTIIMKDKPMLLVIDVLGYGEKPRPQPAIWELLEQTKTISRSGQALEKALHLVFYRDNYAMSSNEIVMGDLQAIRDKQSAIEAMDEIPEGIEDCKGCPYFDHCNENALANANCRTCANATNDKGVFTCDHGKVKCDNHVYHPMFVSLIGFEVESCDPETMTIDYGKFTNGPNGNMTSDMMQKAYGLDLVKNDQFLELMKVFDGRLTDVKRLSE